MVAFFYDDHQRRWKDGKPVQGMLLGELGTVWLTLHDFQEEGKTVTTKVSVKGVPGVFYLIEQRGGHLDKDFSLTITPL